MDLVAVHKSTILPEIAVLKSKLEAAGLHPFVQNYEHAHMAYLYVLALGGVNILVPENEAEEAALILADQTAEFIDTDIFDNYDPPKSYRQKKPYKASFLPIALLIAAALIIVLFTDLDVYGFILGFIAAMLWHAQRLATQIQKRKYTT